MCGIIGFYNPGHLAWADYVMPEAFWANQIRGEDATGVFARHKDGRMDWAKLTGDADQFCQWDVAHKRFFKPAESMRFMVGHNRAATQGDKGSDGAHPHVIENTIYLVHNGTLSDWKKNPAKDSKEKEYFSDSHAIASWLYQEPNFLEVVKDINGAYALVWYDKRDDSLNFARNHQRPLGFVDCGAGQWYFASEPEMMTWLLRRRNREVKSIKTLEANSWMKITPDHKVRIINVPFINGQETKDTSVKKAMADYFRSAEAARASETLLHGTGVKWGDMETASAPEPEPEVSRYRGKRHDRWSLTGESNFPTVIHSNRNSGLTGDGDNIYEKSVLTHPKSDKQIHKLETFAGLKVNDTILFYPLSVDKSATEKKDNIICEGPLMVYAEDGSVSFTQGIEVASRLDETLDHDKNGTVDERIEAIGMQDVIHMAKVTAIVYDNKRKRVRIYAKNSQPQEWFDWDDYPGSSVEDVKHAFRSPYTIPMEELEGVELKKV